MTGNPRTRRRPATLLLPLTLTLTFALALATAAPAQSAVFSYTITGTLDGFDLTTLFGAPEFFPTGPVPFEDGPTYTLTFDLDDSVPLDSSGATFGIYDTALSNVLLTVDNLEGDFISTSQSSVVQTFNGPPGSGATQTWSAAISPFDPDGMSTIPDFDVENEFEEFDSVFFTGLEAVVFDFSGNLFTMDPPELVTPQDGDYDSAFIELRFEGYSTGAALGMGGSVDSVTRVPEPGFALMLAAGVLALSTPRRTQDRR